MNVTSNSFHADSSLLAQVRSSGETTTQTAPASDAPPANAQQPAGGMASLLNMALPLLLVVVVYFLIFRPQQKREKERVASIRKLKKGDKVLTRGGIYGVIVGLRLEEELLVLKIADNVKVELHTNAIDSVNPDSPSNKEVAKTSSRK